MTATRRWTIAIGLAGVGATLVLCLAPVPLAAGSLGEGPADMVFIRQDTVSGRSASSPSPSILRAGRGKRGEYHF